MTIYDMWAKVKDALAQEGNPCRCHLCEGLSKAINTIDDYVDWLFPCQGSAKDNNVSTNQPDPITGPWVKTADRLPEDHEMLNGCVPIVDERGYGSVQKRRVLERYPKDYPWWLPLPALPEKADGTPVIARRDYPQKPTSGLIEEDA